jgi:hypothetical protein
MHRFFFLAIALLTACTSFPAVAAKISVTLQASGRPTLVTVEGVLTASDGDQFIVKTAPLQTAIVILDSDGGSLVAGLQIGEAIRQKKFSTTVATGRRCASACALAWLAGVPRFIGADGKIGFHAAYHSDSGRETGVGNALVGAYLTRLGLSYAAVVYITEAAPHEMTWLSITDAVSRGIQVSLSNPPIPNNAVAIPTRYGNAVVTSDGSEMYGCCFINYRNQRIEFAPRSYLEAAYKVKEGDLLVIGSQSMARGLPTGYSILLVSKDGLTELSNFGSRTFDARSNVFQRGDEIHFDLGFKERKKVDAVYKNGAITMNARPAGPTLPKKECTKILDMVARCVEMPRCNGDGIFDHFAMAGQRYFTMLEDDMPVFKTENFYKVCTEVCKGKSDAANSAPGVLCGY